ncbi:hypothetical protein HOR97_gp12 [Agrobacterium phage Atu_ph03]|uniref:Uncharacterized protein n=1 Tax=Agrobacterium phage Atu_ph03 TaxID=2024262 RepID=A0A2L0UZ15_9CAUD|nr:hypothetical protein HOR97_gp12 [Agrobacterium phage Atu_ph03]AUZ94773.1 hypothetical protein [Agrobacterium phage Atu_ph03]
MSERSGLQLLCGAILALAIVMMVSSCQGKVIMPKPDDSWLWKGYDYVERTNGTR